MASHQQRSDSWGLRVRVRASRVASGPSRVRSLAEGQEREKELGLELRLGLELGVGSQSVLGMGLVPGMGLVLGLGLVLGTEKATLTGVEPLVHRAPSSRKVSLGGCTRQMSRGDSSLLAVAQFVWRSCSSSGNPECCTTRVLRIRMVVAARTS